MRAVIGVTGQFSAVDDLLTGEENLLLMGRLLHLPAAERRARAARLLERFDLVEAARRTPATYSGGMKRRLDIAMTLMGRPRLIFLDEPTAGLDPRSRHTMWQLIRDLVAEGVTILLTTQYLEEADQLADRIAVLDRGRIVAEGTPEELKRRIPGAHIRLRFADAAALEAAARALPRGHARRRGAGAAGTERGRHRLAARRARPPRRRRRRGGSVHPHAGPRRRVLRPDRQPCRGADPVTTLSIAAQDSATMLGRELKHTLRFPLLLVGSILVPVVLLLLFAYILGGPIGHGLGDAARGAPYIDFLVPGILVMTVAAGSGTTAINVCTDMTGGIIDRFRTMPVTRGAVLTGHVGGSVLRTLVTTTVVTGVALLVGFRPQASVADWFAVAGIVAAFSFALAWLSAALGLVAKTVAGANGSTLPIQFLLPFLSSAFVPAASMPAGMRWFAAHQPFTPVVECLRALLTGAPVGNTAYLALAWCAAIALAGYLWARAAFGRGTR